MTAPKIACQCGVTYHDDATGRFYHKRDQGHAPAPKRDRLTGQWAADGRTAAPRKARP